MKGIFEKKPNTKNQRMLEANSAELKTVITSIVGSFTELLKKNPMAGVEILFRFDSRATKDSILNNYEAGRREYHQSEKKVYQDNRAQEALIDLNNFGVGELNINNLRLQQDEDEQRRQPDEATKSVNIASDFQWTSELDEIIINNYPVFISLGKKACFDLISALIPGTDARACYDRGKVLKVKKLSAEECKAKSH